MEQNLTIDSAPVLGQFMALEVFGVPCEKLEQALGVRKSALKVKDARVSFLNVLKMIETGIEMVGPHIPLKLGTRVSLENMGACGYIFKNCKDLEEVTRQFLRYQRLLYSVSIFVLKQTGHSVMVEHTVRIPKYKRYSRILVEMAFSSMITSIEALIGKNIRISELRFAHLKPNHVDVYKEIFRAPLRFNQTADMIIFDKSQLKMPIPDSQVYIKDTLIQHANGLLIGVESDIQLKDEVNNLVMANLHNGDVDIEMIAGKLNMSRWTLTRKLKKEGVTFKNLMDKLKIEAALGYMKDPKLSITDIAFLLGYSEASVFSRAFKKWTGENPSEYMSGAR